MIDEEQRLSTDFTDFTDSYGFNAAFGSNTSHLTLLALALTRRPGRRRGEAAPAMKERQRK